MGDIVGENCQVLELERHMEYGCRRTWLFFRFASLDSGFASTTHNTKVSTTPKKSRFLRDARHDD